MPEYFIKKSNGVTLLAFFAYAEPTCDEGIAAGPYRA